MNDTLPVERKCAIEEVFEASFIELLQLVPANPLVRALILKFTGKLPPAECGGFEQLKDWIEFNCVQRIRPGKTGVRREDRGIEVPVDFSEIEYGRASYSVACSGSGFFHVSAPELVDILRETIADGGGLEEVVDVVAGKVDEEAWNQCNPDLNDYGDYDYDDHDCTGTENAEAGCSRDAIRNAVRQFIRERHPELAAEL